MRQISISIYARPNAVNQNGLPDNTYLFTSLDSYNPESTYQFYMMNLNYSIVSSGVTSTLILSMTEPTTPENVLRSGQPIEITDNNDIVFQGVLLSCKYQVLPIGENGIGGLYLICTLAPSILQLTVTPMIFDENQAQQINTLTGIDTNSILAGGVAQQISSQALVNYMITNTDYANFFNHVINPENLSDQIFVMAAAGQSKDQVLRSSIDFNNVVLFQAENGLIHIRQLDSTIASPFNVDLTNQFNDTDTNDATPTVPMLEYQYDDNAATTPSIVSNYNMLDPNNSVVNLSTANLLTYTPNPDFFNRVNQLAKTGWFLGEIGQTQINENIVSDPSAAAAFNKYQAYPDKYMLSSKQFGAKQDELTAYQALLTGKQLAQALTGYASLQGLISLDDPNVSIQQNMGSVLGSIIKIQNCDLQSGIIATCSRSYSELGSYLNFNITPLGSITGYWRA